MAHLSLSTITELRGLQVIILERGGTIGGNCHTIIKNRDTGNFDLTYWDESRLGIIPSTDEALKASIRWTYNGGHTKPTPLDRLDAIEERLKKLESK